jgi:muconate cycloisomerase
MLIKSIDPIAVVLPMRKPVIMAGEEVRRAENVLVRIETDDGSVGWGEAAAAPTMTGETLESLVAAVHLLAAALKGRAADDIDGALLAMRHRLYGNNGAKAAIEIALHDVVGKSAGLPVHALLGNKRHSRIPLLGTIAGGDRDSEQEDAAMKKSAGITAYKIKVGLGTPEADAARTRAICDGLGPGMMISADANQGFTAEEAIRYLQAVQDKGLHVLEQPVMADDLSGMARVAAAAGNIAIAADEGIHSLDDIRRHRALNAARAASLKAIKLGGLRALVAAGRLCDELGMMVNVSCKTGESSIACAAALHAALVMPNIAYALTLTHGGLAADVTAQPIPIVRGHVESLDRPGLGIDIDENAVSRYRVEIAARMRTPLPHTASTVERPA